MSMHILRSGFINRIIHPIDSLFHHISTLKSINHLASSINQTDIIDGTSYFEPLS